MYRHEMIATTQMPLKLIVHQEYVTDTTIFRHWHQALEINYVVNGKAEFIISGKKISVNSGELVIINSNEIHAAQGIITSTNNLALTFQIPYEFLKKEISNFDEYWFVSPVKGEKIARLRIDLYQYYLDSQDNQSLLLLKSDTYKILDDLVRYFGVTKKSVTNLPNIPKLDKLSELTSFVSKHSSEKITLPILAEQTHLSVGYLSRLFSSQMGVTVMEYVNLVRVRQAFELLTNTDKTIESISDLTGFANPKSFRKFFEQTYKRTPGKYRQELKGHKTT